MNIEDKMILIIRLNGIKDFILWERKKGRGQTVKGVKRRKIGKEVYILCIYSITNASAPRNRHYSYAITRFYYF